MDKPVRTAEDDIAWVTARSAWAKAAALFGAFAAAIGLGFAMAAALRPGSELVTALGGAGFLLAFATGYSIWSSYVIGLFTRGLFGGVARGLFRFLLSRDGAGLEGAAASLRNALADRDRLRDMLAKIRARTSVFRTAGLVWGVLTGAAIGLAGTSLSFFGTLAVFGAAGLLYGAGLAHLAREGYLPLPEEG